MGRSLRDGNIAISCLSLHGPAESAAEGTVNEGYGTTTAGMSWNSRLSCLTHGLEGGEVIGTELPVGALIAANQFLLAACAFEDC